MQRRTAAPIRLRRYAPKRGPDAYMTPTRNGADLRRHRLDVGISQRALADDVGVSNTAIWAIEVGRLRSISPELGDAIARRLGRPVEDMFDVVEPSRTSKLTTSQRGKSAA